MQLAVTRLDQDLKNIDRANIGPRVETLEKKVGTMYAVAAVLSTIVSAAVGWLISIFK